LTWTLDVDHPPRWWPRRLGDQPRCDVEVVVEIGGEASDRRTLRTAFREVQWRRWQLHVNGERLFVMGSNQGPSRMQLGEATPAELARDVQLALDANLDLLRLHAHVSRPELYDAADDAGLLLWQDFPLQWGYARGVRGPGTEPPFYFGWYHGPLDGLAPALRAVPRLARFVTEFGAQAVPESAAFMEPERWPKLDWDRLLAHHACQKRVFDRVVPP